MSILQLSGTSPNVAVILSAAKNRRSGQTLFPGVLTEPVILSAAKNLRSLPFSASSGDSSLRSE